MDIYGVKETQCTRCGHRDVCSLKEEFLEAQKAVDEVYVSRPCEDGKKVGIIHNIRKDLIRSIVCTAKRMIFKEDQL